MKYPLVVPITKVFRTGRSQEEIDQMKALYECHNRSFIQSVQTLYQHRYWNNMKIGYARVSTADQNLDRQRDQLRKEGCERIYEEKQSGKDRERIELQRLLDSLRKDDVVVVSDLTRVSRSVKDLFDIVEAVHQIGAEIKSLHEPWLDTTSPQGRLLFTIFSGISEFERELIRQRTLEGLESAMARGHKGGRPTLDPKLVNRALKMYDNKSFTIAEIKESTGVSKSALYRYIREREANIQDDAKERE